MQRQLVLKMVAEYKTNVTNVINVMNECEDVEMWKCGNEPEVVISTFPHLHIHSSHLSRSIKDER